MDANSVPSTAAQAEELCLVCNDISTGYHYGTPSCNGCKTFFRRTVMKKQTFVCQYDSKCIIDKSVRCACRHCRFEKCLAVGMSKEAIQQNRDPIGYTKRTRRYPPVKLAGGGDGGGGGGGVICTVGGETLTKLLNSSQVSSTTTNGSAPMTGAATAAAAAAAGAPARADSSPQSLTELTPEQVGEDRMLENLTNIERRISTVRNSQVFVQKSFWEIVLQPSIFFDEEYLKKQAEFRHSSDNLRRAKHSDFHYWHERDWVLMIEWAKTIPVYDSLSFGDKLALLRHSAITYPSLNQCFYSKNVDPDTIVFPDGTFFDRAPEPDRPQNFQRKKFKVLDNLLKPMRKMEMDITEFAAAKAIFFLNPDADDLSAEVRAQVGDARCAITNALYRYMVRKDSSEESVDRFGKLLLLGTVISTIAVEGKEAVVVANFFEQIKFSQLAKQLLLNMKEDEVDVLEPGVSGGFSAATPAESGAALATNFSSPSLNSEPGSAGAPPSNVRTPTAPPPSVASISSNGSAGGGLQPSANSLPSPPYVHGISGFSPHSVVPSVVPPISHSVIAPPYSTAAMARNDFFSSAFTSYVPCPSGGGVGGGGGSALAHTHSFGGGAGAAFHNGNALLANSALGAGVLAASSSALVGGGGPALGSSTVAAMTSFLAAAATSNANIIVPQSRGGQ